VTAAAHAFAFSDLLYLGRLDCVSAVLRFVAFLNRRVDGLSMGGSKHHSCNEKGEKGFHNVSPWLNIHLPKASAHRL
jgi:hypothetical protein